MTDASRGSFTACTALPSIQRAICTRPKPMKENASSASTTRAWRRQQPCARAWSGPPDVRSALSSKKRVIPGRVRASARGEGKPSSARRRAAKDSSFFLIFFCLLVFSFLSPTPAAAHDIPIDVTVQAYLKPEGHTLHVLMRLPLKAVQDIEYPHRERDFVDLAQIDRSLRDAATIALSNNMEIFEGDRLLLNPRIVSTRMSLDSDRSFASYDAALAHVTGPPLPAATSIYWEQGLLDVLFDYNIESDR